MNKLYFISYCLLLAYTIQRTVPGVGLCCPLDADRILSFIGDGKFGTPLPHEWLSGTKRT